MSWLCATSKCMSSYSTQWVVTTIPSSKATAKALSTRQSSDSSTPRRFTCLLSHHHVAVYVAQADEVSMMHGSSGLESS